MPFNGQPGNESGETLPNGDSSSGGGSGGGLIGALISAGGAIYSSEVAKRNTDKTIAANKEQAQYAYSQDLAAWNRQNAYNDPAAQMARLKAAGLSPNLVYGNGAAASVGNATQMPKYNAPSIQYNYEPVNVPQVLGAYQDFRMRQAQIDNVKAQTENVQSRTLNEAKRNFLLDAQGRLTDTKSKFENSTFNDRAEKTGWDTVRARWSSEAEWKRLMLMDQEQLMNVYRQKILSAQATQGDIDTDRKRAQLLFEQGRSEWMKQGITSGDNIVLRIFARMMGESGMYQDWKPRLGPKGHLLKD